MPQKIDSIEVFTYKFESPYIYFDICYGCEKKFQVGQKFLKMEFSFCDEYGCMLLLCQKCVDELPEYFR